MPAEQTLRRAADDLNDRKHRATSEAQQLDRLGSPVSVIDRSTEEYNAERITEKCHAEGWATRNIPPPPPLPPPPPPPPVPPARAPSRAPVSSDLPVVDLAAFEDAYPSLALQQLVLELFESVRVDAAVQLAQARKGGPTTLGAMCMRWNEHALLLAAPRLRGAALHLSAAALQWTGGREPEVVDERAHILLQEIAAIPSSMGLLTWFQEIAATPTDGPSAPTDYGPQHAAW